MLETRCPLPIRCLPAALLLLCTLPACFKSEPRVGSETHFMRACAGECEGALGCICGVCTQQCTGDATCRGLSSAATCMAVEPESVACEGSRPPARACDIACKRAADCAPLGGDFECFAGSCRQHMVPKQADAGTPTDEGATVGSCDINASSCMAADAGGMPPPACTDPDCGLEDAPLVMLLVDTSGSMERKVSCACTTPGCAECLPDCASNERNRWITLLEALTGTYKDYACKEIARTAENGATYDVGYFLPHYAPQGEQNEDGVLDQYRDSVRFGFASFDGYDTYVGAPPLVTSRDFDYTESEAEQGLWSYNPVRILGTDVGAENGTEIGSFWYPNCTAEYMIDTGIRGPQATQGALVAATDVKHAIETNDQIQRSVRGVRPFGGTPIAAALDDLYYFLDRDPAMAEERVRDARPYVILIADGYPDDDYRSFGCDCRTTEAPTSPNYCGGGSNDASKMHCPYPSAEEAARELACGRGKSCDAGPSERLYVVGYAIDDSNVSDRLDAIAAAGGSDKARTANDGGESLRAAVRSILDEIVAAR